MLRRSDGVGKNATCICLFGRRPVVWQMVPANLTGRGGSASAVEGALALRLVDHLVDAHGDRAGRGRPGHALAYP
ncbi:MAG: hypothetical protein MK097_14950, partial [Dechloromonas sp.]|nr:hypothetical protein [Dechloromonas sp.]